jgi:hypothetical protein
LTTGVFLTASRIGGRAGEEVRKLLWLLGFLALAACAIAPAFAHGKKPASDGAIARTGSIAGNLSDPDSTPLAGVTVILRNEATGAERQTATDEEGGYGFSGLAPGKYSIEAASDDLNQIKLADAAVGAGIETRVGTQTVQLHAVTMSSDPASAAATTVLSGEQLRALPSSGRHWEEFLLQTPAASAAPGSEGAALRQGGQEEADTTVDGMSTRLAFGGPAGSTARMNDSDEDGTQGTAEQQTLGLGWSGRNIAVSEASVSNVRAVAGNVEAGGFRAPGGRTNIETGRGGNSLHGQAFFFDRENVWGARNPFATWVQNVGSTAQPIFEEKAFTPSDNELVWGLSAGSRIKRNKLFWFAALDGYHRNDPGVASVRSFAGMFAPVEPTSPQITQLSAQQNESPNQAYQDYMGIPRGSLPAAGLEQLAGLLGPTERTASHWVGFARIDWKPAVRHALTLEGNAADWDSPGGGMTRVMETYGSHSFGSSRSTREWMMARWSAYLTANLLATTQGYVGRTMMRALPQTPSEFEKMFLNGNSYGQLPQVIVDSRYGFTIGNPARFGHGSYPEEHTYRMQETLSWAKSKVLMRAGFEVDHDINSITLLRNQTGTFHYTKVQSFISDALAFARFGTANLFNYQNPHNCNVNGKGLGALPCYSYFTQTIGPNFWQISTNDWAGFVTTQWQVNTRTVLSAGLRWEMEQLPPPLKLVDNPDLPLTQKMPSLGSQWGPRVSLALGNRARWPVLRLGYGMYYGRTTNATLLSAISQTGSVKSDLNYFIRPTDGMNSSTGTSSAPPFPNPLIGRPSSSIVPGAVEYAPNFRNPEIHQALASIEQKMPGNLTVTATAMFSMGRRLPISIDTNYDAAANPRTITYAVNDPTGKGPIKNSQITVPFYALWPAPSCNGAQLSGTGKCGRANPSYQQITQIMSRSNSTYEAAVLRVARAGRRGLNLTAHYTYSHAMDWSPNESTVISGSDVLDPVDFNQEYGTSNLDVRHTAVGMMILNSPWKVHGRLGRLANGWMLAGTGQIRSGLPFSMRTSGAIPTLMDFYGNPTIVGIGAGMNGSGGDNRVYGAGRNTYRYPATWKADVRVAKKFNLGETKELELLAESFNLFNHRNVTALQSSGYSIENGTYGTPPSLNYLTKGTTGTDATTPAFGQPLNVNGTNLFRERQVQFGARVRF